MNKLHSHALKRVNPSDCPLKSSLTVTKILSCNRMSFPYEITDVEPETAKEISDLFYKRKDFVRVGPKKYFMFPKYRDLGPGYYNMPLKSDDTWVVTFPRSGTTWMSELVWLINNNVDFEKASKEKLADRVLFLEHSMLVRDEHIKEMEERSKSDPKAAEFVKRMSKAGYEAAAAMQSPRHIRTHFPLSLLPPNLMDTCKVVYVARNPKDVAVSYYNLNNLMDDLPKEADFSKYWELFQNDLLMWTPFWSHVEEAWRVRHSPNILFLFYEDMKKDFRASIRQVADFLNKSLTEEQIESLVENLSITKCRNNPALQPNISEEKLKKERGFFGKGESGAWRTEFTKELNEKADKWIEEHEKLTDLRFQF